MGLLLQSSSCIWPSPGRKVMLGAIACKPVMAAAECLIQSLLQALMCSANMDHRGVIGMQDDADMRKCIQEASLTAELFVGPGPVWSVAPQTMHLLC